MDRRKGYLERDFTTPPFDSIGTLLLRATRLYLASLGFIAAVTLLICLPGKLIVQLMLGALDIAPEGVLAYLIMDVCDIALAALIVPALMYGLIAKLRLGATAPVGLSFRWGYRQWVKMLWNSLKKEITITLWSALLLVPGIIAMMKLAFVEPIVAIEGDRTSEVLHRSRALTEGHRWRIFVTLLPALPLGLVHLYAGLRAMQYSPFLMVPVDSVFTVLDQWTTVVVLLMYLGVVSQTASPPKKVRPERGGSAA